MNPAAIEKEPLLQTSDVGVSLKEHLEQTLSQEGNRESNDMNETNETKIEDEKSPSLMTGDNNKNSDETSSYRDFFTEYGTQRVTIEGDLSSGKPVIVTYHDIGVNHVACYQSLFSIINSYPNILRYFVIVHIDAPGHHYSDNINKKEELVEQSDNTNVDSFDLTKLASFIENILFELKIGRFFAFGVGAGCNVWLEYAKHEKNNKNSGLRGIILSNPTNEDASWREWAVDNMFHYIGQNTQWLRDTLFGSLLPRYNGWEPLNEESLNFLTSELRKIDEAASIKYFRGYTRRKALTKKELKGLPFRFLVMVSEESKVLYKCLEFQSQLRDDKVDFVKFDHGSYLMTESHPQQLIKPIQMFVESMGVSQLTMEMKFGKING